MSYVSSMGNQSTQLVPLGALFVARGCPPPSDAPWNPGNEDWVALLAIVLVPVPVVLASVWPSKPVLQIIPKSLFPFFFSKPPSPHPPNNSAPKAALTLPIVQTPPDCQKKKGEGTACRGGGAQSDSGNNEP